MISDDYEHDYDGQDVDLNILFPKQQEVLNYLLDDRTSICIYGGSIRSAKTITAAFYCLMMCHQYAGCNIAVVRKHRNQLETGFLTSLYEAFALLFGDEAEPSFRHTGGSNSIVHFTNGSTITFYGLDSGRDAMFNRIRGQEFIAAILDEAQEQNQTDDEGIVSALLSRLSQAGKYGLRAKLLILSNPTPPDHWVHRYYKQWRNGQLPNDTQFVQARITDNLSLSDDYLSTLQRNLTDHDREVLFNGNWDYVRASDALFPSLSIDDYLDAEPLPDIGHNVITADVAGEGEDHNVFCVFRSGDLVHVHRQQVMSAVEIKQQIRDLQIRYNVDIANVIMDASPIGWAICNELGATSFVGGSRAMNQEPYANLRTQMFFRLADCLRKGEMTFSFLQQPHNKDLRQMLHQELLAYRQVDKYVDSKLKINRKDDIKQSIKRSPDISDAISMWCYSLYVNNQFYYDIISA